MVVPIQAIVYVTSTHFHRVLVVCHSAMSAKEITDFVISMMRMASNNATNLQSTVSKKTACISHLFFRNNMMLRKCTFPIKHIFQDRNPKLFRFL